jgi:hypothetical protein
MVSYILCSDIFWRNYLRTKYYRRPKHCFEDINEKFWEELIAYFPFHTYLVFDTTWTASNSSIVLRVFVAEEVFRKLLPSNGRFIWFHYPGIQVLEGGQTDSIF